MMPTHKRCSKCRRWWPLTLEYWNWRKDSRKWRSECKACKKEFNHEYRQAHLEYLKEQCRIWAKSHKAEKKIYNQEYQSTHRSAINAAKRKWVKNNRDKVRIYCARWVRNNRDKQRARVSRWRRANPEKARATFHRYFARKHALLNDFTLDDWQIILRYFDYGCAYCGTKIERLTQDHLIPVAQGGGYTFHNIVPACGSCNSRKWNRTPQQANMPLLKSWPIKEIEHED